MSTYTVRIATKAVYIAASATDTKSATRCITSTDIGYVDADNRDNVLPYIQSYLPEAPSTDMVIETFRYDAEVGKITFIIQNSDYSFHERLGDIQFKIATIY